MILFKHDTSFLYSTEKVWGVGKTEGERARERVRCGTGEKSVAVWVINLTKVKLFMGVLEMGFIKMNIKLIPRI
jgi:hypothetical protein